jgi:carbonic anhydrase
VMAHTDRLLRNAEAYAATRFKGALDRRPAIPVAIVTCIDSRIDVYALFGMVAGGANVMRNAGGIVTDDVIRSLAISQRLLGTREVALVHHTDCGMTTFTDEELASEIEADTGQRPPWDIGAFEDVRDDVRRGIHKLAADPFLPYKDSIRGFVYDVFTGALEEISAAPGPR